MCRIKNNIVYGSTVDFVKYKKGLGEYFFDLTKKYGDNICQTFHRTGKKETYREINQRSVRMAITLQELGVRPEHAVLGISKHDTDIITLLGTLYLGARYSVINSFDTIKNWIHCINLVEPAYIIVDQEFLEKLEKCLNHLKINSTIVVIGKSDKYHNIQDTLVEHKEENSFSPKKITNIEDIALILFSSGTTGLPKGICYSHSCLPNFVINCLGQDGSAFKQVVFSFSAISWISGLAQTCMFFHTGSEKIIDPQPNVENVLRLIEKYKITYIYIHTAWLENFLSFKNFEEYDISSLKRLQTGGEYISTTTLRELQQRFKNVYITKQYGCSETVANGCGFGYEDFLSNNLNSVGQPMNNIELKIVDRKSGETLGVNQIGEIYIKSPFRMIGYIGAPDLVPFDNDNFFKTGDLGYYNKDGFVYFLCRICDIIKYKQYEIYTGQLENILKELPAIKEVAVVGIPHEMDNEHFAACIILKENQSLTTKEILNYVSERVKYELKGGVKFLNKLPRSTSNFKILRTELVHLFKMNKNNLPRT